jgi:hypothetical protein
MNEQVNSIPLSSIDTSGDSLEFNPCIDTHAIASYADKFVMLFIDRCTDEVIFGAYNQVQQDIAELSGSVEQLKQGIIAPEMSTAISIFLDQLLEVLYKKKYQDNIDISNTCLRIAEALFSTSDTLTNYIAQDVFLYF